MSPTNSILASAAESKVVKDELGRLLTVRRLTALDTLRLFKAAGPELAQNQAWLGIASLALSVIAVDDIPIPLPVNETQIESIVSRLGEEGLDAAADAFDSYRGAVSSVDVEIVGNSHGTLT
jgi:hypothetical protein